MLLSLPCYYSLSLCVRILSLSRVTTLSLCRVTTLSSVLLLSGKCFYSLSAVFLLPVSVLLNEGLGDGPLTGHTCCKNDDKP